MGAKGSSRKGVATLALLCATTFAAFAYKTVLDTAGAAFALSIGASMAQAGAQASAFFAASIAARFVTGPLADAYGNRRSMLAGLALLALGAFALAASDRFWQVVCARCIQAFGIAAFYPAAAAAVGASAPQGRSGAWLGMFRLAVALPMLFGPTLFLSLAQTGGWGPCFAGLGALSLLAFAATLAMEPEPGGKGGDHAGDPASSQATMRADDEPVEDGHVRPRRRSAASPSALARSLVATFRENGALFPAVLGLSFAASVPFALISGFAVVFAQQSGIDACLGAFFALFGIGGVVGAPAAGALSDRMGTNRLLCASFALEAAGALAFAAAAASGQASPAQAALCLAAPLVGLGKSGTAVGMLACMADGIGAGHRALAIALQQSASDLGSAATTAAFGIAFGSAGFAAAPIAAVALAAAGAALACTRLPRERRH